MAIHSITFGSQMRVMKHDETWQAELPRTFFQKWRSATTRVCQVVADGVEMVAPKAREKFLGYAEIRKVFSITKVGKVAGCMVTDGLVKRGAGVRVLRENVVIHNGELSQLKRFKDDVREVARGYECGLSFANFHDLQEGDVVDRPGRVDQHRDPGRARLPAFEARGQG